MIPQIIHYCWLSNSPIPNKLQQCIDSWKKNLSEYQFIKWDFNRFPKDKSKWVRDAYDCKKYAFAADYIRLYALYHYGGIYLDMDVEVLKSFNDFLVLNTMLGFENSKGKNPEVAVLGVVKHSEWIKICLDFYNSRNFINTDGSYNMRPLPGVVKRCLKRNGYSFISVECLSQALIVKEPNIPIFSSCFFSPKNHVSGKVQSNALTYSIHHFAGSWEPVFFRYEQKFWHSIGLRDMRIILRLYNLFKYGSIKSVPSKIAKKED